MKFDRRQRVSSFEWTSRMLQAAETRAERRRQREISYYPLFVEQVPSCAPFDPHVEARLRDQCARQAEHRMRALLARVWHESRRDMQRASPMQRQAIREGWDNWRGPRTATYFRYVVDLHTGVAAQRSRDFQARQVASMQGFIRSLQAQRGLDLDGLDARGNDQPTTRVILPIHRRCAP